ncbi:MAG: hypothetical protein CVV49_05870 [Spirochaetae bacterium HGW-Spirochaetae-5]|nr:MAG: hypothetical protein CVV49_05870 [Spirochaetae bacterium HGW-Spirochaetae-5]
MDENNKIVLSKVRNFGDNIGDTFNLIRHGFKPIGQACLYVTGPLVLIVSIIMGFINAETMGFMFDTMKNPADIQKSNDAMLNMFSSNGVLFGAGYIVIILFSFIIIALMQAYAYEYMILYQNKDYETITYKDIIAGGKKNGLKIAFTNLGIIFIFIAGVFFLVLLSVIAAAISEILAVFIPIIVMISMFSGFYFMIMFILTPAIRVFESKGFWKSLVRSVKLMYGNFWNTFGLLFILMIAVSILGIVFMIPYIAVVGFMAFNVISGPAANPVYMKPLIIITSSFLGFSTFLYIILFFSIGFKYFTLIEKKEGLQVSQ